MLSWCGCACLGMLAGGIFYSSAGAQSAVKAEYQVYTLKHKSVGDIEKMLTDMLSGLGASTHLVADRRANQFLLRGSAQAQQIARQLIDSVDRPASPSPPGKPVVRTYPGEKSRLGAVATRLRATYSGRQDVRIAEDSQSPQLYILAPPDVHAQILRQLAQPGTRSETNRSSSRPKTKVGPDEHFVRLIYTRAEQIEPMLRDLFGTRLEPVAARQAGRSDYLFVDSAGHRLTLSIDRQRNGLTVFGPEPVAGEFVRLIHTVDAPRQAAGAKVRVVPVRKADPAKVRQAVEAYRSGYREGIRNRTQPIPPGEPKAPNGQSAVPWRGGPNARALGLSRRPNRGGVNQVNYLFQEGETAAPAAAGDVTDQAEAAIDVETEGEAETRRQRLHELGTDVEIEALPNLDVIILRGRDRDVDEVSRIIEEIERLSAETEPAIEVYRLKHVRGESLAAIVEQIDRELIAGRQGRVSVTPLVKPNALLLIGWGEAVASVKKLIRKLDQPVTPETQLRVFRLRHAPATRASTTVEGFFAGRAGLGPKVQVTADPRTNALVVQAAPRDMAEVELLIERLDRGDSEAVSRARVFKLENSLAIDLAGILQATISAARGGTAAQKSAVLELLSVDVKGERILKSGLLNDVQVTPNPRTNTLVVSAPAESMELIAALIKQLDSPSAVAQIKVFKIENGDANDIATMLRTLLPARSGAAAGPQLPGAEGESSLVPLRFSVDQRTNSIIATGSEGDLLIIEALLLRLDAEDVEQRKNTVYRLRNAPAIDVASAISSFLRSERAVQQAGPGTTSPFQQIEREVVVVPEVVSNSLILSATPRFFEDIMDLIEQLDAEPPQVMIQVLIAEVSLGDLDEFGIELGLQDSVLFDRSLLGNIVTTTNTAQQSTPAGIITATEEIIQAATNEPGYVFNDPTNPGLGNSASSKALADSTIVGGQGLSNFAVGRVNSELGFGGLVLSASGESVSVLVRALQESRRLRVLSRPQVMTLDNQPAFIQVGKRVPRITASTISEVGQVNSITLENVGLIMGVTPRISPDGMVVMEVDAEKSELGPIQEGIPVSIAEGTVIRSPSVNITMAQTTVGVADGDTVVLGGLITKSTSTIERRVPCLADIPLLGNLFRYDNMTEKRTELLIILTPHIIRNPEDAERIKQMEAAKMHWCLGDVQEIHGPAGLFELADGLEDDGATEVIYPDLNPRGVVPDSLVPEIPEPLPPGDEIPEPAEASSYWPAPVPRLRQVSRERTSGPVAPADYVQPIPGPPPAVYPVQPIPARLPPLENGMQRQR